MKPALGLLLGISISIAAFANTESKTPFYYTQGSLKSQTVEDTTFLAYEGYGEACYVGNAWKARAVLKNMANDDIEKTNVQVWLDQNTGALTFSYVDTKCTDDSGYESEEAAVEACSVSVVIPACGS
ncbi:hypothetical protein [Pseudobdellovibrio exovorus]|uniref:Uncharacterized protein n=1 Tax=Pseudobdellovibrio exovorus JSS TaxID=1184267 RepID=M4VS29_9BACT|nr:hypothetical protein [Pseudobdellovibrio exovorus]AGH95984.1 hypothetical protein A11Q_1768 [Pseudobdellovibrio exovorus JSS]